MDADAEARCARGTIGACATRKRARRGRDGAKVRALELKEMTIGDVVEVMRESAHETFPTTTGTMISVRGVFDAFVRALVDGLAKPEEPAKWCGALDVALADSSTAETVGLIKLPQRRSRETHEEMNVLDELFRTPATALSDTATPLVECAPDVSIADAVAMLDERDVHAVFTTTDDGERAILTAEDILCYLCPIRDALREVLTFDARAFNALFDAPKDTFLAIRQEHNMDLTAADVMWWMFRQSVNAVAFFESTFTVPGDVPLYGSVFVELSVRDLLDLTPDTFHVVFETDPVAYIATKRTGVFVHTHTAEHARDVTHDEDQERAARDALAALAEKNPARLPKRFYIFHRDVVRAFTPLSLLRALVHAHATTEKEK